MRKIIFSVLSIFLFSCTSNKNSGSNLKVHKSEGIAQGSTYHITYLSKKNINYQLQFDSILQSFDLSLSTYLDSSIISKVNRNEVVEIDELFETVFNRSQQISELTAGSFDATLSPLINYWGFGYTNKRDSLIDSLKVNEILSHLGYQKVSLLNNKVVKKDSLITLSYNAIAQGYSVDVICSFLESKNITNYMVEVGGELRANGNNPFNEVWRIGIDKPIENNFDRQLQAIVTLKNKSLATSGNYRKFYKENNVKYSHTINPETGFPEKNSLLSVTVVANNCMDADAFATAFMVMGLEPSKTFLLSNQETLDAYFIYADSLGEFETFVTPNLKNSILEN